MRRSNSQQLFDVMYDAVRAGNAEFDYSYLLGFAHALMLTDVISQDEWRKVQSLPEVVSIR